jgi:hypothetical protein
MPASSGEQRRSLSRASIERIRAPYSKDDEEKGVRKKDKDKDSNFHRHVMLVQKAAALLPQHFYFIYIICFAWYIKSSESELTISVVLFSLLAEKMML